MELSILLRENPRSAKHCFEICLHKKAMLKPLSSFTGGWAVEHPYPSLSALFFDIAKTFAEFEKMEREESRAAAPE